MNHFLLSAALVQISSLAAGIVFARRQNPVLRYFGFFWLCVSFWTLFVAFQFQLFRWMSDEVWGWWLHIGCISVPIVYFHFTLHFTDKLKTLKPALYIGYGCFVIFILLNTFTDLFTTAVEYRDGYTYPKPAVFYPAYILFFQVYGLWSTWLIYGLRNYIPQSFRSQLNWFLIIHLFAYAGAMDNYLIMYDIHLFPLFPYGLYFVIPYIFAGSVLLLNLESAKSTKRLS